MHLCSYKARYFNQPDIALCRNYIINHVGMVMYSVEKAAKIYHMRQLDPWSPLKRNRQKQRGRRKTVPLPVTLEIPIIFFFLGGGGAYNGRVML